MRHVVVPFVLLSIAGCAGHGSPAGAAPASGREAVMQADRDYAAATAARRLEGWMSFLAEDMVKAPWRGDFVKGLDRIRREDAAIFADTTMRLEWKPSDGGVYSDGRYGYTKGRYESVKVTNGTRRVVGHGSYLTLWRREASGWKVVLDTGVPDSQR